VDEGIVAERAIMISEMEFGHHQVVTLTRPAFIRAGEAYRVDGTGITVEDAEGRTRRYPGTESRVCRR
jgi:hypothetical protein